MIKIHETQVDPDEHVWITIECPDRPTISIDVSNVHGRRYVSLRSDGHGMGGFIIDSQWLEPKGGKIIHRFCPFCGTEISLGGERTHRCNGD